MKDIRQKAKELMRGACRLCSICDGRVCAGEVPGMGGLGSGTAFKNNVKALAEIALNMRLIHTASAPETSCSHLGMNLDMPVVAAPIGGMFNFKVLPGFPWVADLLMSFPEGTNEGYGPIFSDSRADRALVC